MHFRGEIWDELSAQVSDYKDEIDRLNRELVEVKKKFYDQKKREMIQQEPMVDLWRESTEHNFSYGM